MAVSHSNTGGTRTGERCTPLLLAVDQLLSNPCSQGPPLLAKERDVRAQTPARCDGLRVQTTHSSLSAAPAVCSPLRQGLGLCFLVRPASFFKELASKREADSIQAITPRFHDRGKHRGYGDRSIIN